MKTRVIPFLLFLLTAITGSAQGIDPLLTQIVQENTKTVALGKSHRLKVADPKIVNGVDTMMVKEMVNVNFNTDGSIRQLCILGTLNDGEQCPDAELRKLGVKVTCTVGQIVIMDVPAESYSALTGLKQFKWLEADRVNQLDNHGARETNTVSYVTGEKTFGALEGSMYDGTGVVLGVIDNGIDFNHIAFKDADGKTRIKEAITFTSSSNDPIVTTGGDIAKLTTGNTSNSHGSHTSATAGGSYIGSIGKQGMAPGADLVLCDCSNSLSDSHIINSAKEIFSYADKEGKPAVINCSLGSNADFHDGSNAVAKAFNTLTSEKAGRIICISSSNAGNKRMSIRKTINKDEVLKTVMYSPYKNSETDPYPVYVRGMQAFVYSTDKNPFTVEYRAVDITTGENYSLDDKPLYDKSGNQHTPGKVPEKYANGEYGLYISVGSACSFMENNLCLGIYIKGGADNQTIVLTDNLAANGAYTSLLGENSIPALAGFTDGDDKVSMNVMACTPGVISVGSYQDRANWTSIDGTNYYVNVYNVYGVGSISPYSSYGIDDNGKHHPDVLATGTYINSAYNAYDNTYFSGVDINNRVPKDDDAKARLTDYLQGEGIGDGNRPYFYGAMSGTSMSCPVTTGIVALWLQKNPQLTVEGVRELMQKSSIQDSYTTIADSLPSKDLVQAGCGKIDALRGIEILSEINPDETLEMNHTMATFSSQNMLDFRNPLGPKAYVASKYENGVLTFKRVLGRVPANTGLLVTTDATGAFKLPIAPASKAISSNLFVSTADAPVTLASEGTAYVLASPDGKTGFYQNAANLTIPQYKAYLLLTNTQGARSIGYIFNEDADSHSEEIDAIPLEEMPEFNFDSDGEETTTGVKEFESSKVEEFESMGVQEVFNMAGQRVTSPGKGLYIINGKKVIFE